MSTQIFKRKIYSKMLEWKGRSKGSSALLIEGARRVGKSTIVAEFGKNEYSSCMIIDFMNPLPGTIDVFESYGHDVGLLTSNLAILYGKKLVPRESLIVFDEVQRYPRARELIKYLVQDGRYDYIETGSLISIKENVKGIQIPSEEEPISMHPMDFEEWLWANGDDSTMDVLRERFGSMEPLGAMHKVMLEKFRLYLIVGGMPGPVSAFLRNHDLTESEAVKRQILNLYRNDIRKYSKEPDLALMLFNSTPEILSSHSKIFRPSAIEDGTLTERYLGAFEWLFESRMLVRCICNRDPSLSMNMGNDPSRFKAYLLDTGLLVTMAFDTGIVDESVFAGFAKYKFGLNEGMFFENVVAQQLTSSGHSLFLCGFYKKGDDKHLCEVDFLLVKGIKIVPVEVKSSYSAAHASLDILIEKHRKRIGRAVVVHPKDAGSKDGVDYLPVYMAGLLRPVVPRRISLCAPCGACSPRRTAPRCPPRRGTP